MFSIEDFEKLVEIVDKGFDEKTWKKIGEKKDTIGYSKTENGRLKLFSVQNDCPFSTDEIFRVFYIPELNKIENNSSIAEILDSGESTDIFYSLTKLPIMSNRDLLVRRRWRFNNDKDMSEGGYCGTHSIESDQLSNEDARKKVDGSNAVRMNIMIMRKFEALEENKCKITSIQSVDFGGWMPKFLIESGMKKDAFGVTKKMSKAVETMKKMIEKKPEKGEEFERLIRGVYKSEKNGEEEEEGEEADEGEVEKE